MSDLGTLGGSSSIASGINDAGDIVGSADTGGRGDHAFLDVGGTMIDLNSLLPPCSGWELISAEAINDSGQITGYGNVNGQSHAFLLNTGISGVPEPPTASLLCAGALCGLIIVGIQRALTKSVGSVIRPLA